MKDELRKKIVDKIQNDMPIELEFDYRESLDRRSIKEIVQDVNEWELKIDELNFVYAHETMDYYLSELYDEFADELEGMSKDEFADEFRDYVYYTWDFNEIYKRTDVVCLIPVYSNFDCTNSFDTLENSYYLPQVYERVKDGVKLEDYLFEHREGAYGGALFCFAFQTDLLTALTLKERFKSANKILIPKGTNFGFYSAFNGTASLFDKETFRDFYLRVKEDDSEYFYDWVDDEKYYYNSKYDCVGFIIDGEISYSLEDVFCQYPDFINETTIQFQ